MSRDVPLEDLRALDEELQTSRARLRATIDSSPDAIVTTDVNSIILEWSKHAETLFGWSAAEAIGQSLSQTIIPLQHREAHDRGVRKYLATGEGPILNRRVEITALRRNGQQFPVELTVAPAGAGRHRVFNAFIRDLSDRNRLNRFRSAQHAVTRVLAEHSSLSEAAPPLVAALGTELGWELGAVWFLDQHQRELGCAAVWHSSAIDAREFLQATRTLKLRCGQGLPGLVWEERRPIWLTELVDPVKFPRAAVAAKEGLLGAVGFPIFAGDHLIGVGEFFLREALEPDEGLLSTLDSIGRDIAQAIKRIEAETQRDHALADLQVQAAEMEDLQSELEASLEQLQIANDQLQAVNEQLLVERRAAEEARFAAEKASQAKTYFLSNMSHELRTPLNAILGYADLLELGITGPVNEAQAVQLGRIKGSSRHLLGLVEDILDLAKIESGSLEMLRGIVAIREVVDAALQMVLPQALEKGLSLENACDSDLMAFGDTSRVRQIIVNLVGNAVKFTPQGGRVRVSSGGVDQPGDTAAGSPTVSLVVDDTGPGIPPDQIEAVFEPFVQLDNERAGAKGGIGLGLAISREMARKMGGDIHLHSVPGRGASFTLVLPAAS